MIIRMVEWMHCSGKYTNTEQNCSLWVLGVHYIDIQRFIDGRPFAGLSFERSVERAAAKLLVDHRTFRPREMIKLKIVPLPTAELFVQCSDFFPICTCYLFLCHNNLIGVVIVCMCVCICAVLHCRHLVDPLQSEVLCFWWGQSLRLR